MFSNGVLFLAAVAAALVIAFKGNISALIPLYAVGVFTGFTLSQSGMVVHHLRLKEPRWRASLAINAVGAVTTGVVALVVVVSKFTEGAWMPAAIIPMLVLLFKGINRHYTRLGRQLRIEPADVAAPGHAPHDGRAGRQHPPGRRGRAPLRLSRCGPTTSSPSTSPPTRRSRSAWRSRAGSSSTSTCPSRSSRRRTGTSTRSIMRFLDELDDRWNDDRITVIIPEFVVHRWWEHLLHNQSALFLKGRLLFRRDVAVLSLPYHVN